jgi:hypothetical protein
VQGQARDGGEVFAAPKDEAADQHGDEEEEKQHETEQPQIGRGDHMKLTKHGY